MYIYTFRYTHIIPEALKFSFTSATTLRLPVFERHIFMDSSHVRHQIPLARGLQWTPRWFTAGRMATRKRGGGYNQFEGWVLIRFMFGGLFLVQFRWLDLCCPSVSSLEATLDGEDVLSFQDFCRGLQSGLGWFIPIILSHMCSCNLPLSKVTLAYASPHQLMHLRGYSTIQGS